MFSTPGCEKRSFGSGNNLKGNWAESRVTPDRLPASGRASGMMR
jgi:hypothetical protein